MNDRDPLLIEIGCEEIPARMIPAAARDLRDRVLRILKVAGLTCGAATAWGGSRRLSVRIESVQRQQADREEQVLGPPERVGLGKDGKPTGAALGFARKQGVAPDELIAIETDRGRYVGFHRFVPGRSAGEVLGAELPDAVGAMWFPKTMRWGDGEPRWVRPVHWLLALHGEEVAPIELFGCRAAATTVGHRFRVDGPVAVNHPDEYISGLERACVVVDPQQRRTRLADALQLAAERVGGRLLADAGLLEEVADLVEWPGIVAGEFDLTYLDLPREILVTTLRHHQKCFAAVDAAGALLPVFFATANTDDDPRGHIRRGNEWVVNGRLEDARFFWNEDTKRPLDDRGERLGRVVFHARIGSYADKARRMEHLAARIAERLGMEEDEIRYARSAALRAKNDLVTGTVGEFPELQGRVGGLMLAAEGEPSEVSGAVYAHYQPVGPEDEIPPTGIGCVVAVADKLDTVSEFIRIGETPTGSRDPFGLRRATSGLFRIVIERRWAVSLRELGQLGGTSEPLREFLFARFQNYLRDGGAAPGEIQAVFRPQVGDDAVFGWPLHDIVARIDALRPVREREDFSLLADLTKRVDNILVKGTAMFGAAEQQIARGTEFEEQAPAALRLDEMIAGRAAGLGDLEARHQYADVVDLLAEFVQPVEQFFQDVLVLDPEQPHATLSRRELLRRLHGVLTQSFDIRELAGQADRSKK